VVGVSTDPPEVNARFRERLGLRYPLLSDEGGKAVAELGIASPSGRARRTTFYVDGEGTVRRIWRNVKVAGHAEAVLQAVAADT
jgi:peroxiredoxin Q/BCP